MATKEHDRVITKQNSQANEKDCSSGTKIKRKSRSARKRLTAMMSNTSLHFSDTDSEGELTMITNKMGKVNATQTLQTDSQRPLISITGTEDTKLSEGKINDNLDYLIADSEARSRSRRNSFAENLTDVDEIYSDTEKDTEIEEKDTRRNLNVIDNSYQRETDLEDMEDDEDIEPTIYVAPRSDILKEFADEMITTKEGDGPFSVEVRNRLSREQISVDKGDTENVSDVATDSEDVEASEDEDKLNEAAACSHIYEDVYEDILSASQIVMTNKLENTLQVQDVVDEASDCHTDVEDVD